MRKIGIIRGGKESAVYQTAREGIQGPVRSLLGRSVGPHLPGVRGDEFRTYFRRHEETKAQPKPWTELLQIAASIHETIGTSQQFIGGTNFANWASAKSDLQRRLSETLHERVSVADYCCRVGDDIILFRNQEAGNGQVIVPFIISPRTSQSLEEIAVQLKSPAFQTPVPYRNGMLLGLDPSGKYPVDIATVRAAAQEQAILGSLEQIGILETTGLFKVTSIANEFTAFRHEELDREGSLISALRHKGAESLGELQSAQNLLVQSARYDGSNPNNVTFDHEAAGIWMQAFTLAFPEKEMHESVAMAEATIIKFAQQKVYFDLATRFLQENPTFALRFLESGVYERFATQFRQRYLATYGQSETDVANAMLANYLTWKFSGEGEAKDSQTQKHLANIPGFHEEVGQFAQGIPVTLPEISNRVTHTPVKEEPVERIEILLAAKNSLETLQNEIARHAATKGIIHRFHLGSDQTKLFRLLVGHVGLAHVDWQTPTMSSWFPFTDGYIPNGKPLEAFTRTEASAKMHSVEDAIRFVFQAGTVGASKERYSAQVDRMQQVGSVILDFLQYDERVPQHVREFIQTIASPNDLPVRILERFGPLADQDPNIVNRFFQNGFAEFQQMALHRYVTDFLRGVESNLIFSRRPFQNLGRRFGGKWQEYDFSHVPQEALRRAVDKTLTVGAHRLRLLNHEEGERRRTLKDWQEFAEIAFGWNTYDMKFLRWSNFWNQWNTLGGAWECICFSRKPIFNTGTFQQF